MAIVPTKLDSNVNQTATGAFNTASVTIGAGVRALVAVKLVSSSRTTTSVAGTGITFSKVSEGACNTADSISWWKGVGPVGGFTGVLTITPSGGISQGHYCVIGLAGEASNDADWLVQSPAIATATAATSVTAPLSAPRDTGSRSFVVAGGSLFGGLNDSATQTELCDHPGNSPAGAFAVSWSDTAWDANPTYATAGAQNWGALALEISPTNVVVPPSGILPQVWDGAAWLEADAVWTWDGADWVEGTLHAYHDGDSGVVIFLLASLALQGTASAQAYQIGWWYKYSGSAQVVAENNHYWVEGYDAWANFQGRFVDDWLDWYCQIEAIYPGDNQGTPLRIQLAAPYGSGAGCIPVQQSQYQGWTDGLGNYSGQNFWHPGYVAIYESYVFPRSGNNSRGTTLEIY